MWRGKELVQEELVDGIMLQRALVGECREGAFGVGISCHCWHSRMWFQFEWGQSPDFKGLAVKWSLDYFFKNYEDEKTDGVVPYIGTGAEGSILWGQGNPHVRRQRGRGG